MWDIATDYDNTLTNLTEEEIRDMFFIGWEDKKGGDET